MMYFREILNHGKANILTPSRTWTLESRRVIKGACSGLLRIFCWKNFKGKILISYKQAPSGKFSDLERAFWFTLGKWVCWLCHAQPYESYQLCSLPTELQQRLTMEYQNSSILHHLGPSPVYFTLESRQAG